jgi:hypothetical protein
VTARATPQQELRQVFEASQGAMTLVIVTQQSAALIVAAAMRGDATATTALAAADRVLRRIHRRSRANALPCVLCDDNAVWRSEPPGAVALLMPYGVEAVRVAVGFALCTDCATGRAELDLARAAVARFRATSMPDIRQIAPMAVAGHA